MSVRVSRLLLEPGGERRAHVEVAVAECGPGSGSDLRGEGMTTLPAEMVEKR